MQLLNRNFQKKIEIYRSFNVIKRVVIEMKSSKNE